MYLIIDNGVIKRYTLTNTCEKPRIAVTNNGYISYIPLTNNTFTGDKLYCSGKKVGDYITSSRSSYNGTTSTKVNIKSYTQQSTTQIITSNDVSHTTVVMTGSWTYEGAAEHGGNYGSGTNGTMSWNITGTSNSNGYTYTQTTSRTTGFTYNVPHYADTTTAITIQATTTSSQTTLSKSSSYTSYI